jgi:hypothetical protein
MTKPNAMDKAEQMTAKYQSKQNALIQAKQVYYMRPTEYWERVIKELEK